MRPPCAPMCPLVPPTDVHGMSPYMCPDRCPSAHAPHVPMCCRQVLLADREVLQDQIVETELRNEQLSGENEELRLELQTLGMEKQKVGALCPQHFPKL